MEKFSDFDKLDEFLSEDFLAGERVKISPDFPLQITPELLDNKAIYLYTKLGSLLGIIALNNTTKDNKTPFWDLDNLSYSFILPSSYKVLLPVPKNGEPPTSFLIGNNSLKPYYYHPSIKNSEFADKQTMLTIDSDGILNIIDLDSDFHTEAMLYQGGKLEENVFLEDGRKRVEYVDRGEDGSFSGIINGNSLIAGFTSKIVGGEKHVLYQSVNEDSYCVNYVNNRVVVADGIGSHPFSEFASELASTFIANSKLPLQNSINNARIALHILGYVIEHRPPDTVFMAVEFDGDSVNTAYTGDCSVIHVSSDVDDFGKKVFTINKTRPHTSLQLLIDSNTISERKGFSDPYYLSKNSQVTTTLWTSKLKHKLNKNYQIDQTEYRSFNLKKGDYIFIITDGASDLTTYDILKSLAFNTPEKICFELKNIIKSKNDLGSYLRYIDDGKAPLSVPSSLDNTTLIVYKHDS